MKQPAWKVWLSYLTEIVIETGSTDVNEDLQLGLKKGRYCLSTPNAIYSYADLYDNFTRAFQQENIKEKELQQVLVLGFGLGSIPYMLEKVFGKNCRYTGVELDELVAMWAAEYVLDELHAPVQMNLTDAATFVEMCQEKFDLITMDIFVDNKIPEEFQEVGFLENLKHLLNDDGLLMYNRLYLQETDKQETTYFFHNQFKSVFPKGRYVEVGANWMLLSH